MHGCQGGSSRRVELGGGESRSLCACALALCKVPSRPLPACAVWTGRHEGIRQRRDSHSEPVWAERLSASCRMSVLLLSRSARLFLLPPLRLGRLKTTMLFSGQVRLWAVEATPAAWPRAGSPVTGECPGCAGGCEGHPGGWARVLVPSEAGPCGAEGCW